MKILILTFVSILTFGSVFGQTAFDVEVKNRHQAPIIINDEETGRSYFLYYYYYTTPTKTTSSAYLAVTDSEFNKLDEKQYKSFPIMKKYIGGFAGKNNFYMLYQGENDRAIRALQFSKKGLGWEEKYVMPYPKKELIIGVTAHKDNFYMLTFKKKESGIRVYEIPGDNVEDYDMEILDPGVEFQDYIKGDYLNELNIAHVKDFVNVVDAATKNKMYYQDSKVYLTMDLDDGDKNKLPNETILISLDVEAQTADHKILEPNLDATTASFLLEDKIFQFAYLDGKAEVQVFNVESGDKIQSLEMHNKMDTIPFQNTLVSLKPYKYEQKYNITPRRFLNRYKTWTPYLLGEIVDGEIVLTIGSTMYDKGLATGGGVVSGTSGSNANDVHIFDWYFHGTKLPKIEGNTDLETHLKRYTAGHISKDGPISLSLHKKMGVMLKKHARKDMIRVFKKGGKLYLGYFDKFNGKYTVHNIAEME